MTECREGEKREPRFVAEPPRNAGGFDRDVGNFLRVGHLGDSRVGYQYRAPSCHDHRYPDHAVSRLGVDHVADVLKRDGEIARYACDHRISVAQRDHAGSEMVAVLINQPLTIAHQIAAPLQTLIEIIDVCGVAGGKARIDDLNALAEFDAALLRRLTHAIFAAEQKRGAEPLMDEACRCAYHLFLFAFGKDHALWLSPQPVEH